MLDRNLDGWENEHKDTGGKAIEMKTEAERR